MAMSVNSLFIKQAAVLEVIEEYNLINFSTLKRQFLGINDRTLRYHLKRLVDLGFIKKRGTTKGVYYEALASQGPTLQG
ncbi:MAG: hypothetical protein PHQ59_04890 [Candidatus Daviesbacteria bacterium]|nr:hypothetical protein [Candidatus Daviesbacteria bacterium]